MSVQYSIPLELIRADAGVAGAVHGLNAALAGARTNGTQRRAAPRRRKPGKKKAKGDAAVRFIALLGEKGEMTTAETRRALGLKTDRAVGGVIGAMNRWSSTPGSALRKISIRRDEKGAKHFSLAK